MAKRKAVAGGAKGSERQASKRVRKAGARKKTGRPSKGARKNTPGNKLRVERLWLSGWSQRRIAAEVGISPSLVARWLAEEIKPALQRETDGLKEEAVGRAKLAYSESFDRFLAGQTKRVEIAYDDDGNIVSREETQTTKVTAGELARLADRVDELTGAKPVKAKLTGHLPHEVMPVQTPRAHESEEKGDEPPDHDDWDARESKFRSAGASRERVMEEGVARLRRVVARIRAIKAVAEAA